MELQASQVRCSSCCSRLATALVHHFLQGPKVHALGHSGNVLEAFAVIPARVLEVPATASTIEIDCYYQCDHCRERLKLEPTPANLKKAARHRAAIIDAIESGSFDYQVAFPRSKNGRKFLRGDRLDNYLRQWLNSRRPTLKASTIKTYETIIERLIIPPGAQAVHTRSAGRFTCGLRHGRSR